MRQAAAGGADQYQMSWRHSRHEGAFTLQAMLYWMIAGWPLYAGAVALLMAMALAFNAAVRCRWVKSICLALAILGATLVTLSAAPLPLWLYVTAGVAILPWFVTTFFKQLFSMATRIPITLAASAAVGPAALGNSAPHDTTFTTSPGSAALSDR